MIPTSTNVSIDLKTKIPASADAIAVFVHKQTKANDADLSVIPSDLREVVSRMISSGGVTGKTNEVQIQLLDGAKPKRLVVIGLGNRDKFSLECLREGSAMLAKTAPKQQIQSIALIVPATPGQMPGRPDSEKKLPSSDYGPQVAAEGFLLGSFKYREYKGTSSDARDRRNDAVALTIVVPQNQMASAKAATDRGRIIGDAQNYARTIASRPGNNINPPALAKVAQQLAKEVGLGVRVFDEKQMAKLGMGGILAVGGGSIATPPRMIILEHKGSGFGVQGSGKKKRPTEPRTLSPEPLLLVGKSITFDAGGISIKPAEKMGDMIFDKSGGMAVLGAMYAIAKLKLPIHVVGILSSAENILSSKSYRPGDLLRMYNGVTVEVTNTDAEGRLVLGDALAWGIETYKPRAVVDLATLTGGCVVALGHTMAGVMCNDEKLYDALQSSADNASEKIWRLPLSEDVRELIKSQPADIVNSAGRWASPLQGGAFLSHFVPEGTPWAHMDIAGVADTEKETSLYAKGSTGWGVRTLIDWVSANANSR
ncbi:MAG TPA: leucyl aminopeptidase [Tepidisphaeraceae bacterium]|jgi:leucyl aminopeptidase|nr:leucyl aminopeptidase [Tepidisphaeraceae bacterium]